MLSSVLLPFANVLGAAADVVQDSQSKVIVDIGSNKGYFLFKLLDEFLPGLGLTPDRVFRSLNQVSLVKGSIKLSERLSQHWQA